MNTNQERARFARAGFDPKELEETLKLSMDLRNKTFGEKEMDSIYDDWLQYKRIDEQAIEEYIKAQRLTERPVVRKLKLRIHDGDITYNATLEPIAETFSIPPNVTEYHEAQSILAFLTIGPFSYADDFISVYSLLDELGLDALSGTIDINRDILDRIVIRLHYPHVYQNSIAWPLPYSAINYDRSDNLWFTYVVEIPINVYRRWLRGEEKDVQVLKIVEKPPIKPTAALMDALYTYVLLEYNRTRLIYFLGAFHLDRSISFNFIRWMANALTALPYAHEIFPPVFNPFKLFQSLSGPVALTDIITLMKNGEGFLARRWKFSCYDATMFLLTMEEAEREQNDEYPWFQSLKTNISAIPQYHIKRMILPTIEKGKQDEMPVYTLYDITSKDITSSFMRGIWSLEDMHIKYLAGDSYDNRKVLRRDDVLAGTVIPPIILSLKRHPKNTLEQKIGKKLIPIGNTADSGRQFINVIHNDILYRISLPLPLEKINVYIPEDYRELVIDEITITL